MKKILAILVATAMLLTLTACGTSDDTSGSGGGGGGGNRGEKAESFEGTYTYNPPKDNYLIKWTYYDADGSEGGFDIYARIGQGHTEAMNDVGVYHASENMEKYYQRAWEGEYSDWMLCPGYGYSDWLSDHNPDEPNLGSCDAMEEYFMHYFRAYGFDEKEGKLNEYYVGTEKVNGIDCWVFDSKGLNTITMKYWIDPSNGCCLKYMDTEDGDYAIVTEYNLNYTEWTDNLAPASYEGID